MDDLPFLKIGDSMENQLRAIDTMRRVAEKCGFWTVISEKCPSPSADDAEEQGKRQEALALLHYARIGVHAAHGKL